VEIGDLVVRRIAGGSGRVSNGVGIVTSMTPRWRDAREDEMLATVLYPQTGVEIEWSEHSLEVINESR